MTGLLGFNLAILLFCGATFTRLIPRAVSGTFVEFLHVVIGITTPTERHVRVVLIVWSLSVLVTADTVALLMKYVF